MKKFYFLILLLTFSASGLFATTLSGPYTINPALAATTTNFKTFASAITYLTAGTAREDGGPVNVAPFGVSGPVVFEVAAATYTLSAAIIVPAITGSSSTNTITFDGGAGNATTRIITASLASQAVVRMNLCSYVSFKNLTIANTSSGARSGIAIIGNATTTTAGSGCSVINCIINLNSGASAAWAINITATANGHGATANRAQDITIDSNTINGGNYGVAFFGAGSTGVTLYNANIKIRNNTINNINLSGIDLQFVNRGIMVMNNKINMYALSTAYGQAGISLNRCENTLTTGGASHIIAGNLVKNANTSGLNVVSSNSTPTYPTMVYNNMIVGGFRSVVNALGIVNPNYGFFISSTDIYPCHIKLYHNSVLMDYPSSTVNGLRYENGATGTAVIKNNIFSCSGAGALAVPVYLTANNAGITINNNDYFNSEGGTLLYRAGNSFTSADYKVNAAGGDSSIHTKPAFKTGDAYLASGCNFKGTDLSAIVPTDIDGNTRNNTPDMGAHEFNSSPLDIMAERIVTPSTPVALGYSNVSILLRNVGSSPLSNYNINYIHNGATPVTQLVTNILNVCDTVTVTFATPADLLSTNTLSVFTSDPNGFPDNDRTNDTLKAVFAQPLNGSYTIGGTSPDFVNFEAAANALKAGVSGPVEFTVAAGSYNTQVLIDGPIPGSSATNTIVFNGVNRATRIITANTPASAVVLIRNASHITFKNFTITGTNAISSGFALAGSTRACQLKNSTINMTSTGLAYGVLVTGAINGYTITDNTSDSVVIDSNVINKAYHGIYVQGDASSASSLYNSGLNIRNNDFNGNYYTGISAYHVYNAINVLYNRILMDSTNNTGSYGVYLNSCENTSGAASHQVIGNYVKYGRRTAYHLHYLNGTASNPDKIYNNMVAGGFGFNGNVSGIYLNNKPSGVSEVYHNTINLDSSNATAANSNQACLLWAGSPASRIKNNIFVHPGIASKGTFAPFIALGAINSGNLNNNIYYNAAGTNLLIINSVVYTSSTYNTNSAGGDSSFNVLPPFAHLASRDLRLTHGCFKGTNLIGNVPSDIYGTPRTVSVLGAHSPTVLADNLAIQQLLQPVDPITIGAQDLIVRIWNIGSNPVFNFSTSYTHNGSTPVTQMYSGTLNSCDTMSVAFENANRIVLGVANNIKVYVGNPNFNPDTDRSNDTLNVTFIRPMNGTYFIGTSGGSDFTNFTDAINALYTRSMTGPVSFIVNPGTYTEQIEIVQPITGHSAINTITFDGVDAGTRILTFSGTTTTTRHTVKIAQSHIRFRNLRLENNSASFGWIFHVSASGIGNIHVKNCVFRFTNAIAQQERGNKFIGVVASAHTNFFPSNVPMKLDSIEIDSNRFEYANVGIGITNSATTTLVPANIKIRNNQILSASDWGIYLEGCKEFDIANNIIDMRGLSAGKGIQLQNDASVLFGLKTGFVRNNLIQNAVYGIQMIGVDNHTSTPLIIANNIIRKFAGGTTISTSNGIYLLESFNIKIYHNSINFDVSGASVNTVGPVNLEDCGGVDLRNNLLVVSNQSLATIVYSNTGLSVFTYNNLYKAGGGSMLRLSNTFYNKNNFRNAVGMTNFNIEPIFENDSLLTLTDKCLRGDSLLAYDYAGNARGFRPTIGAHEALRASNNAGVSAIQEPSFPIAAGFQDVRVRMINLGSLPLTSANVTYQYASNTPVSQLWSGNLQTCDTFSVVFNGSDQLNITGSTTMQLKAYTSNPNAVADTVRNDDTVRVAIGTPLNGTYTIGGTTPDFATFTDALNGLKYRGVDGPVIFNVRTGIYNEAISITEIPGTSSANTVTFKAETNIKTDVTIGYTGTASRVSTVNIAASYVNFKSLTIEARDSVYARCINFEANVQSDTIENCMLISTTATNNSTNKAIISATDLWGGNLAIRGNQFLNGSYGVYLYGVSPAVLSNGNSIDSNMMNGALIETIHAQHTSNIKIRRNTITPSLLAISHVSIYTHYCDNALEINANKITQTAGGGTGIYHQLSDGNSAARGLIANNVVLVGGGNTMLGLYSLTSSYTNIYNNTINIVSSSPNSGHAAYFQYTAAGHSNNAIRNNIFSNTGGGFAVHSRNPSLAGNLMSDNLIYTTGASALQVASTSYATLTDFRGVYPAQELRSLTYRPAFTNANSDLSPNPADSVAWVINGRGVHNSLILSDANGVARPAVLADGVPDWGAHEFTPTAVAPRASATPASPAAGTTQTFIFLGDTVAQIVWETLSNVPDSAVVRQYPGVSPQGINMNDGHTFFYTDIAAPAGSYNYALHLYYKDHWLGNISSETNMKLAKKSGVDPWSLFTGSLSEVETVRNRLSAYNQSSFSAFTGTDELNPLPVVLTSFKARPIASNVLLTWKTASEINSNKFMLEASADGMFFRKIGEVKAKGNRTVEMNYSFVHENAWVDMKHVNRIFYRLISVDIDGSFKQSDVIEVVFNDRSGSFKNVTVYPNPSDKEVSVSIPVLTDGKAEIKVVDIHGKTILERTYDVLKGVNNLALFNDLEYMEAGIYFIKIVVDGQTETVKIIRQ